MQIRAENLGKRFSTTWIFRNLNIELKYGGRYCVTGPNGSGKSTLLQILAGITPASQGKLTFTSNNKKIDPSTIYKHLTITAPYLDLPEELTLKELLSFHFRLKPLRGNSSFDELVNKAGLSKAINKQIRHFSSGMKQRIKLLLVLYTDVPLIFLDEPTSNLDQEGIDWYKNELEKLPKDRLVIIFSNQAYEYEGAEKIIHLEPK